MDHSKAIEKQRRRRSFRVRKRTRGTTERPRLCVTRSHRNIVAQVVDDLSGKTLVSASTADKGLAKKVKYGGNIAAAEVIGKAVAEMRGEWIAMLDADDLWVPDKLQRSMDFLAEHPNLIYLLARIMTAMGLRPKNTCPA